VLGEALIGASVDTPFFEDDALREQVSRLDRALTHRDDLEAESRLGLVVERLLWHLTGRRPGPAEPLATGVAQRARDIIDTDPAGALSVAAIAQVLHVSTAHLVRSFHCSFGIPPHQYVLGRRLDLARRRLLAGDSAASVASATGFHDQAHLTRHFKRLLATTPGRYQRSGTV
jgi:AraC-like DNA-binding protein